MLFGYPIEATSENWLHECLEQILRFIHNNLTDSNISTDWAEAISEPYKNLLKRRLKITDTTKPTKGIKEEESKREKLTLGDKLLKYQESLQKLTDIERAQILKAFSDQNNIASLLSGNSTCEMLKDLPEDIRQPIKVLFEFAFDILTPLGIRDKHYKMIYDVSPYHICPFCGTEYFDAPSAPREALDHYLSKEKYPFAAANLHNLVPMGNKCNSRYKLAQDILRNDDGVWRKSFNPYNHQTIIISLDRSKPFAGEIGNTGEQLPEWEIDFIPSPQNSENVNIWEEKVTTWNEVFHIKERYKRDILDEGFNKWLTGFRAWCRHPRTNTPHSEEEWIDAIQNYTNYNEEMEFEDRAFLKAAVFRMLCLNYKNGNQRVIQFIKDVVNDDVSI